MTNEMGNAESHPSQRVKQQISVPFCWEEKPGKPKRGWSLNSASVHPIPTPLSKLAASVPFSWEEKPGTPLPHFAQTMLEPLCVSLVYSVSSSPGIICKNQCTSNSPFIVKEVGEVLEPDVEAFPFDTENSHSNEFPSENSGKCESWDSESTSEADSENDSSGSGMQKSIEDVSILEFLFPLSSPEKSFLEKICYHEKANTAFRPETTSKKIGKSQCDLMAKRAPTLGELILLSRRLSCGRRNLIPKGKWSINLAHWNEFIRKRVHICGLFRTNINQLITEDASEVRD